MIIKYFDDFNGTWNDISGSTGATLVLNEDGTWGTSAGYKKWVGLLSQTGTGAPTYVELENTLGETLTSSYNSIGNYSLIKDNIFSLNKTYVIIGSTSSVHIISTELISNDGVRILVKESDTLNPANGILNNTPIEIRVYN